LSSLYREADGIGPSPFHIATLHINNFGIIFAVFEQKWSKNRKSNDTLSASDKFCDFKISKLVKTDHPKSLP
jgi:hypothetical protein